MSSDLLKEMQDMNIRSSKVIVKNKYAFFNYEFLDKYEAGIVLLGWEIKSIRANNVQIKGSFVSFKGNEAYISNMNISKYMNVLGNENTPRKLLLSKSQLKKLKEGINVKGMTIVPTTLKISSKGLVKLDIALAKGKSKIDKREIIKERDFKRNINKI